MKEKLTKNKKNKKRLNVSVNLSSYSYMPDDSLIFYKVSVLVGDIKYDTNFCYSKYDDSSEIVMNLVHVILIRILSELKNTGAINDYGL